MISWSPLWESEIASSVSIINTHVHTYIEICICIHIAHLIVDLSNEVSSISEYKDILKEGELKDFQFTDDFIHNVWRAMGK